MKRHTFLLCFAFFASLVMLASSCTSSSSSNAPNLPDISKAQPYTVISSKDTSIRASRKRRHIQITSTAISREERAQTAMKAAIDSQQELGLDMVEVWLEPDASLMGLGYQYAIARYAPDGRGFNPPQQWKWEVEASEQIVRPQALTIAKLWFQNRDSFQTKDGITDEPKLEAFIAKKLSIPTKQVNLDELTMILMKRKNYPLISK
jgi:hypothetical protein